MLRRLAGKFRSNELQQESKAPMDEAGIDDRLREAIRSSGQSARQIATSAGVSQGSLSRFLLGADMRISSAARVARWLGLELREKKTDA
jgi:transcriptional regulator with XRE-family HTH domain